MFHLVVVTLTGARYLFRFHQERTYASSWGSSAYNLSNEVVSVSTADLKVGQRLPISPPNGGFPFMYTSRVQYWELTPIYPSVPYDEMLTVTSHDDVPFHDGLLEYELA